MKKKRKTKSLLLTEGTNNEELEEGQGVISEAYNPDEEVIERMTFLYDELDTMIEVSNMRLAELNFRTKIQFIDDCQKRANGYVPTRESQGKENWQSNIFVQSTRNKVKALLASASKDVPEISMMAVNEKDGLSVRRSEVMKHLVEASYLQGEDGEEDNNPELAIFYNGWDCAINGTVILYDGYLKTKHPVKMITKYDPITGEIEWDEREEVVDDRPINISIPLSHFYYRSSYIRDIQKQPSLAWVEYMTKDEFFSEFGHYPNATYVKTKSQFSATIITDQSQTFFLRERWQNRASEDLYEVVRYYNKKKDIYRIACNGVELLNSCMLWGKRKKKYPFAKQIFEPFANSSCFLGNSLCNILMGEQDVENALVNSMNDKTYRSLTAPMVIGMVNKDNFDLEDEYVDNDTKIYVSNVDQVKPLPVSQVNSSEVQMLSIIRGNQDRASTDGTQSGTPNGDATARGIVIANERAEEIKGLFFTMMKDLWLQKYRLRTITIAMNYSRPKVDAMEGEEGADIFDGMVRRYIIPNSKLSDGKQGNLQIEVVKGRKNLQKSSELDVRETVKRLEGQPTEIVQITSNYLDDYEYIIAIQSENMYQKSKALKMALAQEKIKGAASLFPQIFQSAQDEFFKDFIEAYNDNPDRYLQASNTPQQSTPNPESAIQGGVGGQPPINGLPAAGNAPAPQGGNPLSQVLPALSGT